MKTELIPLLKDNYAYLLTAEDGSTGIVDPSTAEPVIELLTQRGLTPDIIINTHHHWDHTGGNKGLKDKYDCKLAAPAADAHRIDNIDIPLSEGSDFEFGGESVKILETPGHTSGHICLFFPESKALFCGDTLFSCGCGRLFEGTAEQMWDSFQKIMALPDDTSIYCGHEYTLANATFCKTIEPDNADIKERIKQVEDLRAAGEPTIPSTLGLEKKTNAFLRAGNAARFAEIRTLKDNA